MVTAFYGPVDHMWLGWLTAQSHPFAGRLVLSSDYLVAFLQYVFFSRVSSRVDDPCEIHLIKG